MTIADFQTPDGWLTIAPFDHRASLARSLKLDLTLDSDVQKFIQLKALFMQYLSPHASAVLTDPEYGIKTLDKKDSGCGLFLSLEQSGYGDDPSGPTTLIPNWGIDGINQHRAGAKLLVYYTDDALSNQQKLDTIHTLYQEAVQKQVVFLVEPVFVSKKDPARWIEDHLAMCRAVAPFCDILKIQYPGSPEACAAVSQLHQCWILLSRGAPFETFCEYLNIAKNNGAKGFAAGRAIWQELTAMNTQKEWEQFLATTAVERLEALTAILRHA